MKHYVDELYELMNKDQSYIYKHIYVTADYVAANNLPIWHSFRRYDRKAPELFASAVGAITSNRKGYVIVRDVEGEKIIYLYGEKTWFDTEEERDNYRAQATAEYDDLKARNKVKKEIMKYLDEMSLEQLEMVLAKFQ